MNLDVYNTHLELYPYSKGDYPIIEDWYTAIDKFTGKEFPCGYLIDNNKLYLPKGTSIAHVEQMSGAKVKFIKKSDPSEKMTRKFYPLVDPRDDLQRESIQFMQRDVNQVSLNLRTGYGKTYCVAYSLTDLSIKTIIITPNDAIKQQWINTFLKMFEYKSKHIMNISGSNVINGIMLDEININDTNIFLVNHQTLHSYLFSNNAYEFSKFFKKIKVGIKVYDESHLNFMNILLIDYFTNTERTWYLTATFDRSDKTESKCFQKAFSSVEAFGKEESHALAEKHILYHVVNINSKISPKHRAKIFAFPGFTVPKYSDYIFFQDPEQTMYNTILKLLNIVKDLDGKILIFVPLINAVDEVVRKLKNDISNKKIMAYHSKISKSEKENIRDYDIIVSTIKSTGTGVDIPGLRVVINTEALASKVLMEQTVGRLRPYAKDKDTYFFDIVDISIANCNYYFRARFKVVPNLVKQVIYLDMNK